MSKDMDHLINYHPFFQNIDYEQSKLIYFYNEVPFLIQIGPTCGLVVLIQAQKLVNPDSESISLNQLLNEAQKMGLTNQGEMFSAKGVEKLAKNVLNLNATTLNCLESNKSLIIESLINNSSILIPYDTDANHEPALRNGLKAHWCICTGFGLHIDLNEFNKFKSKLGSSDDTLTTIELDKPIINLKNITNLELDTIKQMIVHSTNLNLFCKQGKSKYLKSFPFDELVKSNKNLFNINDSKNNVNFVLPEEGIEKSLCNQFVLIKS